VLAKLCQVEMFTGLRGAMSTLVGCHGFREGYYYESTAKGDLGVSGLFPMSATIACTCTCRAPPLLLWSAQPLEILAKRLRDRARAGHAHDHGAVAQSCENPVNRLGMAWSF
jgi:hypothetical protein